MTIAACYVSPEGVVLGADSTTTNYVPHPSDPVGGTHHFNYGQKIFEVGEESSIGIATWGLGSLLTKSYRTLVSRFGDELRRTTPQTLQEVAIHWSSLFWTEYCASLVQQRARIAELISLGEGATREQGEELATSSHRLTCGFCIGGHTAEREPQAFEMWFRPQNDAPEPPMSIPVGTPRFWGWSNLLERLNFGVDEALYDAIITSGHWSGTPDDLIQIVLANRLTAPIDLPLRDAIDWVHASIYTTIKAIKFSHFSPVCGGPIEIAVITTDRKFRWVCHKTLDAAISLRDSHAPISS